MTVIFDAEPLLAFAFDEQGAGTVEHWLDRVYDGDIDGYMPTITLTEFRYVAARNASLEAADTHIDNLRRMGMTEYHIDELWDVASELKARYSPALGDAYALAAAKQLDSDTDQTVRHEERLQGRRLDEVLARLASVETGPEGALSAYVPDGTAMPTAVREAFGERAELVARGAPCLALADDANLIGVCLRPPLEPEPFAEWREGFHIDRAWFQPRGAYTLALVRSDLFAMGTYRDGERTAFHGFEGNVKSQHSKGGFSQARFERLRDEQIEGHLDRCRVALDERETDRLYVVGERSVLGEVSEAADETAAVDATGDPETALADAAREFWTVQFRVVG
jgi:predicted nucleic acid-binding protein